MSEKVLQWIGKWIKNQTNLKKTLDLITKL